MQTQLKKNIIISKGVYFFSIIKEEMLYNVLTGCSFITSSYMFDGSVS